MQGVAPRIFSTFGLVTVALVIFPHPQNGSRRTFVLVEPPIQRSAHEP
jgi:hypothetical protein